ncbi:MAG: FAD-dependent monooxygenase [Acidobacteria bacterium]|nr:FAD-dependent monooxygenase [Acidobacteriota bacterium]
MLKTVSPTIALAQASTREWDAIVVGAGPAGAFAARGLARAGLATLLVDRKPFPRHKVCGGCLNARAVGVLESAGLVDELRALGARSLSTIQLRYGGRYANIALPPGLAITRATLDAVLVGAAISAGCVFLPETAALVDAEPASPEQHPGLTRQVTLQQREDRGASARARIVVVADGLGNSSLRDSPSMRGVVDSGARIGIGAVARAGCVSALSGCVTMTVGRGGYVGLTDVENGQINIAAALDVDFLRAQGGPAGAVRAILTSASVAATCDLETLDWQGTVPLTRHVLAPVAHRVFVLGDAAGYIEPFTGEGMEWALSAADALVPLAVRAVAGWDSAIERRWIDTYDRVVRRNQNWCRFLARALRYPPIVGVMVAALRHQPGLARPFLARTIHRLGRADE